MERKYIYYKYIIAGFLNIFKDGSHLSFVHFVLAVLLCAKLSHTFYVYIPEVLAENLELKGTNS